VEVKDEMLAWVRARAENEARQLAGEFARCASEEKEAVLAALEFEQWLASSCRRGAGRR
jgi:hypothetical protein